VYLTTIVDDMLITSASKALTLEIVNAILAELPGNHLGLAKNFNGMRIAWKPEQSSVHLSQYKHIQTLYDSLVMDGVDMEGDKSLPIKTDLKLCKGGTSDCPDSPPLDTEKYAYRSVVGALTYLSCCTRPDVAYTVNQLAKHSNAPTEAHWQVAVDCVKYLYGTINWGIQLGGGNHVHRMFFKHTPDAVAYADANHGTGIDDKRSVTGLVMQVLGGPVSWASRVQPVTATSTVESEFRALSEASREALWLAKIIKMFEINDKPFLIRGDSAGAIASIKNHTYTPKTKHIEIHHDFMKDRYAFGDLDYEHVPGVENMSDIFTKALNKHKFNKFRHALGMRPLLE
jgi:histone deacetylase 1/2